MSKPCLLMKLSGTKKDTWLCQVSGQDVLRAGASHGGKHAKLRVEGMEYVLAASNEAIISGETTILAEGAFIGNYTLKISEDTELTFGTKSDSEERQRKLVDTTGSKTVLVARVVTTYNEKSPRGFTELQDLIFGVSGDQYNLKSQLEGCSYDKVSSNRRPERLDRLLCGINALFCWCLLPPGSSKDGRWWNIFWMCQ